VIEFRSIQELVKEHHGFFVNESNFEPFSNIKPIDDATKNSLVFVDKNAKSKDRLIAETQACTVICDEVPHNEMIYKDKCLIVVDHPKLFFAKLANQQLSAFTPKIDPAAIISVSAKISKSCYIGPHVVIGEHVEIGENTFIHSNCSIYDHVKIGRNVCIDAGCTIGAAGFGFVREEESGRPVRFPQLGSVVIEDDVEIGANTCIDRGALQNTIIHRGVKIDNLVQIAHNVEINEYTYIMGATAIGGSTRIGKRCWISTSRLLNKITIGDDVTIGLGAVVLKHVPAGATFMGNPAMNIEDYVNIQYKLKKISKKSKELE
jgi:UDP-3-O-[3-hydroxymyristoyl] glucosamine N-acyltransferase